MPVELTRITFPPLVVGNLQLNSRLILGTGKYASLPLMQQAHEAAGTELVTVALRRVPLNVSDVPSILDYIDTSKIKILPNTAGAETAEEVVRMAAFAVELGYPQIKVEVLGDTKTLLPNPIETLRATELLRKKYQDTVTIMTYTNDDPILAYQLYEAGADAVMPAGSPIGSGRGISNPYNMQIILENLKGKVPVILDAGVGSPADATFAMELGFDAILLNSAIALSQNPVLMAQAFQFATHAGFMAYEAGRIPKKLYASASSPLKDF
ncbi:MAG: thiazole synthase [Candidatus Hydrogenedentota bacterium]|nr:MAG: thiazole synthase [Candidatus Hydrogenedentota bacterium]